jgi:NAD(P)-dependent dehydrogenase (short-subunit alcohol dehydrogenase family)
MDGKTAVVTGASRGIGAAVARDLAEAGAHVVLCARDEAALADVAADCGERATTVRADVRDQYDVELVMEKATRAGPDRGIDAVVANAGVNHGTPGEMPMGEEGYDRFDDTVRTNVRGVFSTVVEALPHMDAAGRVLVPSGSVAREAKAGMGTYAVSKAAAEALVRQFAVDADPVVGVVDPGLVATDLVGGQGRDPADVAPMYRWALAEADAEDVNGERVDLRAWRKATR